RSAMRAGLRREWSRSVLVSGTGVSLWFRNCRPTRRKGRHGKMASFAEALYSLPTSRLRALVQTRGVPQNKLSLTPSKRQLVQFLATEFSRAPSVVQAVLKCNARELRLLQVLAASEGGNEISWPRLLEAAGGSSLDAALSAVMTRLEDLGLAFRL